MDYSVGAKLRDYGLLMGYSALGIVGLGYFAFKMIMLRQGNMIHNSTKSRVPVFHSNMKQLASFGMVVGLAYTYGLYYLIMEAP